MNLFTDMTATHAAAFYVGLLIVLMLGLKMYVGNRRGKLKVPSGETHPEFNRATRVQLNAVEDVPVLMVGIMALAALNMPTWYIHMVGVTLLVSRILHAWGLAGSSGFSPGRLIGTAGTMLVYLAVAGALLVHSFVPPHG
ncbi:MAG: glutathione S-transferase [Alphaproteobacteria bacterium]|nr:glutathione S-transferase [Alphaproteobacteria bacterium]